MRSHQRGVDLFVNLMDAEQHFDIVTRDELRQLISESVVVFGQLLERDIPADPSDRPALVVRRNSETKKAHHLNQETMSESDPLWRMRHRQLQPRGVEASHQFLTKGLDQ